MCIPTRSLLGHHCCSACGECADMKQKNDVRLRASLARVCNALIISAPRCCRLGRAYSCSARLCRSHAEGTKRRRSRISHHTSSHCMSERNVRQHDSRWHETNLCDGRVLRMIIADSAADSSKQSTNCEDMQMQQMRLHSAGRDLPARHCPRQAQSSASLWQRAPQSRPAAAAVLCGKRGRQPNQAGNRLRRVVAASASSRSVMSFAPIPAPSLPRSTTILVWLVPSEQRRASSVADAGSAAAAAPQRRTSRRQQRPGRPASSCSVNRCEGLLCLAASTLPPASVPAVRAALVVRCPPACDVGALVTSARRPIQSQTRSAAAHAPPRCCCRVEADLDRAVYCFRAPQYHGGQQLYRRAVSTRWRARW